MDDRKRTLAAITVIIGVFLLIFLIVGVLVTGNKVLSPVPDDDNAIKIIFVSPSPSVVVTPTLDTPTPSTKATSTKKP